MTLLTDKAFATVLNLNDLIHIVDVSDLTGSPFGTSKKITLTQLQTIIGTSGGIYSGSGTIPTTTVATLTDTIKFQDSSNKDLLKIDQTARDVRIGEEFISGRHQITFNVGIGTASDLIIRNFNDTNQSKISSHRAELGALISEVQGNDAISYGFKVRSNTSLTATTTRFEISNGDDIANVWVANSIMSIGLAPATSIDASLHIKGLGSTTATQSLKIENSSSVETLIVRDDNTVAIGNPTTTTSKAHIKGEHLGMALRVDADNLTNMLTVQEIGVSDGFVGINTATRINNEKFGVNGNMSTSGVLSIGGAAIVGSSLTMPDNWNLTIGGTPRFGVDSSTTFVDAGATGKINFRDAADNIVATIDTSTTAGDTRFMIYDVDNATLERVTVGIADSGGAGFKLLKIPN